MSFDLQQFLDNPKLDTLEVCRKNDLVCIAAHFDVHVPKNATKGEIQAILVEKLGGITGICGSWFLCFGF